MGSNLQNTDSQPCAICYEDKSELNTHIYCGHSFHLMCLLSWWSKQCDMHADPSCPLCRYIACYDEREYIALKGAAHRLILKYEKSAESVERWLSLIKARYADAADLKRDLRDYLTAKEFIPTPSVFSAPFSVQHVSSSSPDPSLG